jgi:hypothetical protein
MLYTTLDGLCEASWGKLDSFHIFVLFDLPC